MRPSLAEGAGVGGGCEALVSSPAVRTCQIPTPNSCWRLPEAPSPSSTAQGRREAAKQKRGLETRSSRRRLQLFDAFTRR